MAAAAEFPANEIGLLSQNVLGLTANQANALSTNGWQSVIDFEGYGTEDIKSWMTTTARLPVNRGGVNFPSVLAKRVFALSYWVNRAILRGQVPDPNNFDTDMMRQSILDYPVHDMFLDADDTAEKPDIFKYEKWTDWQDSFVTFLKNTKSVRKSIPLYYIIRTKPNPIPVANMTEDEIVYNAPHNGAAFIRDNKLVHTYLTELTNGTDADNWIKTYKRTQDGRGAWIDLCNNYDGLAEGDKRIAVARSDISVVHYRNEAVFSFEQYSTKLRKAFQTLEDYGQGKCEAEKVEILLKQVHTSDAKLISSISICRDSHAGTFDDACQYLSKQIAVIYPQQQPNAIGRNSRGRGRGRVRNISSIKRKNGKITCNGVDLTDTTRYFTPKEFSKTGEEGRKFLNNDKKRKKYKNKNSRQAKKQATVDDNRHVAAIINGVINATRNENASNVSHVGTNIPLPPRPQHGPHARPPVVAANQTQRTSPSSNSMVSSQITYDHNGNIVNDNTNERLSRNSISKVTTSSRSSISSSSINNSTASTNSPTSNVKIHPSEIDNHADTHCFGENFIPFAWSGLECDVSPFLDEYDAIDRVSICAGATAYTLPNGNTVILIFGQGLWFGSRMQKSLINPNQCRSFGISVCDDPTDPYRSLGFQADDVFIPMEMKGTTTVFTSRTPTPEEMDTCPKYIMSDIDFWDPQQVTFPLRTLEVSTVNQLFQGEIGEYDLALSQISSCFDSKQTNSTFINQVMISRVKSKPSKPTHPTIALKPKLSDYGTNTMTKERHHHIHPSVLSQKWGCGLITAKNTLQGTTQLGVRSAIGPLTRRYRTDLLQLHYKRLNTTFYTDTAVDDL